MNTQMARPGIGFGDAVRLFFKRYTDFSGRSSLSEYWYAMLAYVVFTMAWGLVVTLVTTVGTTAAASSDNPGALSLPAMLVVFTMPLLLLAIVVPMIAIAIRRIRDTGSSPLLYLLVLVPFGGFYVLYLLCQPSAAYPINGIPAAGNPMLQAYGQYGDPTQPGNPHYGQSPYAGQPQEIYGQQPTQAPYGQAPQASDGQAPQAPYGQAALAPQAPYGNQPPQSPYGS
ncbi:DUF805 domain-containing protein [Micrococcales bacterium 31B]|nr:DUF805 domain-containing protein [Micrococcales bacterium 31B]